MCTLDLRVWNLEFLLDHPPPSFLVWSWMPFSPLAPGFQVVAQVLHSQSWHILAALKCWSLHPFVSPNLFQESPFPSISLFCLSLQPHVTIHLSLPFIALPPVALWPLPGSRSRTCCCEHTNPVQSPALCGLSSCCSPQPLKATGSRFMWKPIGKHCFFSSLAWKMIPQYLSFIFFIVPL